MVMVFILFFLLISLYHTLTRMGFPILRTALLPPLRERTIIEALWRGALSETPGSLVHLSPGISLSSPANLLFPPFFFSSELAAFPLTLPAPFQSRASTFCARVGAPPRLSRNWALSSSPFCRLLLTTRSRCLSFYHRRQVRICPPPPYSQSCIEALPRCTSFPPS